MPETQTATMHLSRKGTTAVLSLEGDWVAQRRFPEADALEKDLKDGSVKALEFETTKLGRWDSGLLAFLVSGNDLCNRLQIEFKLGSLPEGVQKLIRLSQAVPEKEDARGEEEPTSLF